MSDLFPQLIKKCSTCKTWRSVNSFSCDKTRKDGLQNKCKLCSKKHYQDNIEYYNEYNKQWKIQNPEYFKKHYQDNIEHYKKWNKRWRLDNKEYYEKYRKQYYQDNQEEINERNKQYYQENKEKVSECQKQWKLENPEYNKQWNLDNPEYAKQWRLDNPETSRGYVRKRRALKRQVSELYTKEDELKTLELFDHQCANCGSTDNLCIDHHYPLSRGHALSLENAVVLCKSCNSSKGNKLPGEFYEIGDRLYIEDKLRFYQGYQLEE